MAPAAAFGLWSEPASMWSRLLCLYPEAIKIKAEKKSKPQARKELLELDEWYQEQLPPLIKSRTKPHLTLEEISKLMKWKLSRGKFRPALPGLVAQNKPDDVVKASMKAFSKMPDLSAAIQALSTLRGIGPATASAVLAAGCPEDVPFMADECVLGTPGISVIKYDLNCYLQFAQSVKDMNKKLNKEDPDIGWTCHKVELALWTHAILTQFNPKLLVPLKEGATDDARTSQDDVSTGGRKRAGKVVRSVSKRTKKS